MTTNGPHATHPYFIRLSKTGDPNAPITYNVGNGGPTLDQRAVIDASSSWCASASPLDDPDVLRSPGRRCDHRKTTERGQRGTATTATATGTAPTDMAYGPSGQYLWPGFRPSAASTSSSRTTGGGGLATLAMSRFSSGVGRSGAELEPASTRSILGTDPTVASIGFDNGAAFRLAAYLVRGLVREACARPRHGPERRAPAVTHTRYVANTQGTTPRQ